MKKKLPQNQIEPGLVFGVPLKDGTFMIGQVLDRPAPALASIVLFKGQVSAPDLPAVPDACTLEVLAVATTGVIAIQDCGWPIIRRGDPLALPQDLWPNEATRHNGWVGMIVNNTVIIESFADACVGLYPWRSFTAMPDYFDNMLFPGVPRPEKADVR